MSMDSRRTAVRWTFAAFTAMIGPDGGSTAAGPTPEAARLEREAQNATDGTGAKARAVRHGTIPRFSGLWCRVSATPFRGRTCKYCMIPVRRSPPAR